MERYQNRLYSSSLKEDSSLTELLPVKSAACSFTSPQLENGQDRTERKSSSDTRSIKGWPQTSKTLRKMDWKHKGLLVIDILIGLIPLSFIGKSQDTTKAFLQASRKGRADADRNSADYCGRTLIRFANIDWWRNNQGCYHLSMLKPVHWKSSLLDISQGPTVFPIVFATIVGRSLKSLALFQAERGARLGVSYPTSLTTYDFC